MPRCSSWVDKQLVSTVDMSVCLIFSDLSGHLWQSTHVKILRASPSIQTRGC